MCLCQGPGPNWFQLWYSVGSNNLPIQGASISDVKFMDPHAGNALFAVVQWDMGGSRNEYEVAVPNCRDVLIEWTQCCGTTLAYQTNTGCGYGVNNPDQVTLQ